VIPTEWIRAAQWRWQDREEPEDPITCIGVDPSRGGMDLTELAPRIGHYYKQLLTFPGSAVPDGQTCADVVEEALEDDIEAAIHLDVVGIGSSGFDFLAERSFNVIAVDFRAKTDWTDKSGLLKFKNVRAAAYWALMEDLDPQSGVELCLPPGDELLAELAAPRYVDSPTGILLEPKKNIRKRLGRSPGKADAVVLAHWEPVEGIYFK